LAGTAGVPPANAQEARSFTVCVTNPVRASRSIAGGSSTPSDKKHLLGTPHARGPSQSLDPFKKSRMVQLVEKSTSLPGRYI
jgi:hypothetical protein